MYQQIMLLGNVGGDVEFRHTPSGVPVGSFNMAVNKTWKDSQDDVKEQTVWFRITVWRKTAVWIKDNLASGDRVFVVGEMDEPFVHKDKNNNYRASLQVTAQIIRRTDMSLSDLEL